MTAFSAERSSHASQVRAKKPTDVNGRKLSASRCENARCVGACETTSRAAHCRLSQSPNGNQMGPFGALTGPSDGSGWNPLQSQAFRLASCHSRQMSFVPGRQARACPPGSRNSQVGGSSDHERRAAFAHDFGRGSTIFGEFLYVVEPRAFTERLLIQSRFAGG